MSADMVAAISGVSLADPMVPGDTVKFGILITNQGDQTAVGKIGVDLYASTDRTLDAGDIRIGQLLGQSISLNPGQSKLCTATVVLPSTYPAGDYFTLANIDPAHTIAGDDLSNNVSATDAAATLAYKFGTFGSRKSVKLIVGDADGSAATFTLSSGGYGELRSDGSLFSVALTGTTAVSAVKVAVKGGDGQFTLGAIRGTSGTESLKSISAKAVNFAGGGVDVGGYLGALAIRDLSGGADVLVEGAPGQKTQITVHEIGDGSTVEIGNILTSLAAARIGEADIFAPSIGSISVKGDKILGMSGDFSADITVSGEGVAAGKLSLGKLSVAGMFQDGLVLVNGSVGSVRAAAVADDIPGEFFGVDAKSIKSAVSADPVFTWVPKGPAEQSVGDFRVITEARPSAWPLKDAAWDLELPGAAESITWQDAQGQTIQSEARSGEVQIVVDPWETSVARIGKIVAENGGTIFAQLPAQGFYWARVGAGEEAAFISALAGMAVSAYPHLATGPKDLTIPTDWAEDQNPEAPGTSGMSTGNVVLEGVNEGYLPGTPLDLDGFTPGEDPDGPFIFKNANGRIELDANGNFKVTTDDTRAATHTDVVNYFRSNGYALFDASGISQAASTVAIPGNSTASDMVSLASVIQRAEELGKPATINLSWGWRGYQPDDPSAPAGWQSYNRSSASQYLSNLAATLESPINGATDALVVHASGNESTDLSPVLAGVMGLHPTGGKQIIEVGALERDADGKLWVEARSNFSRVDGSMIYVLNTAKAENGIELGSTSFATAQLQYLVAKLRESRPDLTPAQIRQVIFDEAVAPRMELPLAISSTGEKISVPVIENPRAESVFDTALAKANELFPPGGITVSPTSGLVTTEGGGKATFTVVLDSEPVADVTVGLGVSDATEGRLSKLVLVFTSENWGVAQTVTVTGVNDSLFDGNQPYTITIGDTVSTDPAYDGLDADDISATNFDNDEPGTPIVTISSAPARLVALGGWADFEITISGTVSGQVGTHFDYVYDQLIMDSWTGVDAYGRGCRAPGDPPSTSFSFVYSLGYIALDLPTFYTVVCNVQGPGPVGQNVQARFEAWLSI